MLSAEIICALIKRTLWIKPGPIVGALDGKETSRVTTEPL